MGINAIGSVSGEWAAKGQGALQTSKSRRFAQRSAPFLVTPWSFAFGVKKNSTGNPSCTARSNPHQPGGDPVRRWLKRLKGTSENVFGETHSGTVPERSDLQTRRNHEVQFAPQPTPLKDETIGPRPRERVGALPCYLVNGEVACGGAGQLPFKLAAGHLQ